MNQLNSPSCRKFYQIVNVEVATGQFSLDLLTKWALQNRFLTSEYKRYINVPEGLPLTEYDLYRPALDVMPKLRFSHLMSLLEAFVKEYIAERNGVALEEVNNYISPEKSSWNKAGNKSTSLYDMEFVNHVLVSRYHIDLSRHIQPVTFEIGAFRMCLTHHQGFIINDYLGGRLKNTIIHLGLNNVVGSMVTVTHKLMGIYIEDFRAIMRACDYA